MLHEMILFILTVILKTYDIKKATVKSVIKRARLEAPVTEGKDLEQAIEMGVWECNTETPAERGVTEANCFVYKIE